MKVFSTPPLTRSADAETNARSGPGSPQPANVPGGTKAFATRRALTDLLRNKRTQIAADWSTRHLKIPELSGFVRQLAGDGGEVAFYRNAYLHPLLELLQAAVTGSKPAWTSVYLDERTRFLVPADVHLAAQEATLERVIRADIDDLVRRLPRKHGAPANALLTALHVPLWPRIETMPAPVRVLLVGDCVMTELRAFLSDRCRELQTPVKVRHQYLNVDRGSGLNLSDVLEHIDSGTTDLLALSFFTFEGHPLYRALLADAPKLGRVAREERIAVLVRLVDEVITALRAHSDVPILLHTACGLPLTALRRRLPFLHALGGARRQVLARLNHELRELANGTENVILIDEFDAMGPGGVRGAAKNLFARRLRRKALFHTSAFGPQLADAYAPVIAAYARLRRTKVLLVDFDNTLWSGVMADGEVKHDIAAQRLLRQLREAGILLVALSKNDPQSIRWREMHLEPDDFVLHRISWNQKVQSVDEAAQLLSLGRDSFAVIDDNPVERALIADRYPEVCVLDPAAPATWKAVELMLSFPNTRQTDESAARTALYREAANRREAMVEKLDYPQMMASLKLAATWSYANDKDIARVHELLQRTNQFNTTTKRRTLAELRAILNDPRWRVFTYTLGDRFGHLGLVGVVIAELQDETVVFDSVVMSCRAMGFGLESLLVRAPLDVLGTSAGVRRPVRGLFYRTEKNEPASSLFKQAGFEFDSNNPEHWLLAPQAPLPDVPPWLNVTPGSAGAALQH